MNNKAKIYIAGHRGLVGSAILENLMKKGYSNILTRTHKELDLTNQADVASFFEKENNSKYLTEKEIFISELNDKSVEDLLKEIIYRDEMRKFQIEKIRSNSASLVNWLIVIPIIIGILFFFLKP